MNELSRYSREELLKELLDRKELLDAPGKIKLFVPHYEVVIGIGRDHTASILIEKEAYDVLCGRNRND